MANFKDLLHKLKNNSNIKLDDKLFENLINQTKFVFNNQKIFIKKGPEEIFIYYDNNITNSKVFKMLYEKKT